MRLKMSITIENSKPIMGKIIHKINQFAVVTGDVDTTARLIRDTLELGPLKVWDFKYPSIFDTLIDAQPEPWQMKLAFGWIGEMQFEIIEPTGGNSLYKRYMDRWRKPGIQHLLIDRAKVPYPEMKLLLRNAGIPIYNEAKTNVAVKLGNLTFPPLPMFLAKSMATTFGYTNTLDTLRVVLEISKYPPGIQPRKGIRIGVPTYWTNGKKEEFEVLPPTSLITGIDGFIVLVNNLDSVRRHYEKIFGSSTSLINEEMFYTLESNFIKIIQPGPSTGYAKILAQNGEGVQILSAKPRERNKEKMISGFLKKGFKILEYSDTTTLFLHSKLPFQLEITL
jgi:hypothetical protein